MRRINMNFIIPIVVGSVIGYFTNWLAIKMLFRPYYEKRIFGMKVPFTPGLIPKERERIAKNVGEAVGNHLLSKEVIQSKILSDETETSLRKMYYRKLEVIKREDKSLGFYLEKANLLKHIDEEKIGNYIFTNMDMEKIVDSILDKLEANVKNEENLKNIEEKIVIEMEKALKSKDLKRGLEKIYNDNLLKLLRTDLKFEDVISNETFVNLEIYINTHRDGISDFLKEIIDNPEIRISLRKTISKAVDDNVSRLITSFVSTEKITEKIMNAIDNYVYDNKSKEDLAVIIGKLIDMLKQKDVSVLGHILKENLEEEYFAKVVISQLGKDELNKIGRYLVDNLRNYDFSNCRPKLKDMIMSFIHGKEFVGFVNGQIKSILDGILSLKISYILERLDFDEEKAFLKLKDKLFSFGNENLPVLLEKIDVAKIVEDNINSFDLEFGERLILDIAEKELKAITWLGALLGAIMGILTPLLQMI